MRKKKKQKQTPGPVLRTLSGVHIRKTAQVSSYTALSFLPSFLPLSPSASTFITQVKRLLLTFKTPRGIEPLDTTQAAAPHENPGMLTTPTYINGCTENCCVSECFPTVSTVFQLRFTVSCASAGGPQPTTTPYGQCSPRGGPVCGQSVWAAGKSQCGCVFGSSL